MEISWMLAGSRPVHDDSILSEDDIRMMLEEAFLPDRKFKLFLCGAIIDDKDATLEEMEVGFDMIKNGMENYEDGDYGIVSIHEQGSLLFLPIELSIDDEIITETDA